MCSGDLMETQPAYMGDALFDEWIKTLDAALKGTGISLPICPGTAFHSTIKR